MKAAGGSAEMFEDNVIETRRNKGGGLQGSQSLSLGLQLFLSAHSKPAAPCFLNPLINRSFV